MTELRADCCQIIARVCDNMRECKHVTRREKEREHVTRREKEKGKERRGKGKGKERTGNGKWRTENGERRTTRREGKRGGKKRVGAVHVPSNGLRIADNIAYNTLCAVNADDAIPTEVCVGVQAAAEFNLDIDVRMTFQQQRYVVVCFLFFISCCV